MEINEKDDYAIQMERNLEVTNTAGINLRHRSRRELNKSHRLKVAESSSRVDFLDFRFRNDLLFKTP